AGLMQMKLNRAADLVGRFSGGVFAALLPAAGAAEARSLGEDVRRAIEEHPFNMQDEPIRTTVSIGVAALRPGEVPAGLLKRAEDALAAAKRAGRNRVEVAP
ncbi:MAG TPA: diguanylate cyclase, partial [Planctomycetota bacterium]|nr:diguanylate cyclase [Planctomycetota bacterium]